LQRQLQQTVKIMAETAMGLGERSFARARSQVETKISERRAPQPVQTIEIPQWFTVQTKPRFEKKFAELLAANGIEVFLPLRRESHSWSDRRKQVTVPVFPGYAFVHWDGTFEMRSQLVQTEGFAGFVNFRGTPALISPKQIEDLRLLLRENLPFSVYPFVQIGQRVRIVGGCLNGLEGVLSESSKGKLVISINSLQRSLGIELQGYDLELI
jgi:transcription antitermination factor NusG